MGNEKEPPPLSLSPVALHRPVHAPGGAAGQGQRPGAGGPADVEPVQPHGSVLNGLCHSVYPLIFRAATFKAMYRGRDQDRDAGTKVTSPRVV